MAKKKDRAFFICPHWNEGATSDRGDSYINTAPRQRKDPGRNQGRPARRSIMAKSVRPPSRALNCTAQIQAA